MWRRKENTKQKNTWHTNLKAPRHSHFAVSVEFKQNWYICTWGEGRGIVTNRTHGIHHFALSSAKKDWYTGRGHGNNEEQNTRHTYLKAPGHNHVAVSLSANKIGVWGLKNRIRYIQIRTLCMLQKRKRTPLTSRHSCFTCFCVQL